MKHACKLIKPRAQAPIGVEPFRQWALPNGAPWTDFYRNETGYLLRFPNLADFEVSADASKVTCSPAPGVSEETSEHLFLNQVLPLVLSKRGKLVFHASAVEVPEGAIAFLAETGRGKSTLAASFALHGYRFLTDDGLVVESDGDGYQVMPSHPSIRLWKDSQKMLADPDARTAPPLHFTSKVRFLAGEGLAHCDQTRPLRRAYFLGDGSAQEIVFRRLCASEALIEWVKHSFLLDVEDRSMVGRHFDQVAKLANRVPCYHLDYPRRFEDLGCLRQSILEHAMCDDLAA